MRLIFTFVLMLVALFSFSQSSVYLGKNRSQVSLMAQFAFSQDSTETWRKSNVYVQHNPESIMIHDLDNFKVVTCYFDKTPEPVCISFKEVYYNLSESYVESKLAKSYQYNGGATWNVDQQVEYCLEKRTKERIFIVEACKYYAQLHE